MSIDRVVDPNVPKLAGGVRVQRYNAVAHPHFHTGATDIGHQRKCARRPENRFSSLTDGSGSRPAQDALRSDFGIHPDFESGEISFDVDEYRLIGPIGFVDQEAVCLSDWGGNLEGLNVSDSFAKTRNIDGQTGARADLSYGRDWGQEADNGEDGKEAEMLHDGQRDRRGASSPSGIALSTVRLNRVLRPFAASLLICLSACNVSFESRANDLKITNVRLVAQDVPTQTVFVEFDVAWDNSWRLSGVEPNNRDAVWLFVKYRVAAGAWSHATLATIGHALPSGAVIEQGDGLGVFIFRSSPGTGTSAFSDVRLRWSHGADGVSVGADQVEVRVLGIEMVYVPQGDFAVGGVGVEANRFTLTTINTSSATTTPAGVGSKGGAAGGYPTGKIPPSTPAWPNGYRAFYIQKYEITQGQYAEFLNLLTPTQAASRYPGILTNRFTITGAHPNFSAAASARACNQLSWADGAAYADWAGLRPMTELEFEKAARGTALPVPNEYVWGTTAIHAAAYSIGNDGSNSAYVTNPGTGVGNGLYYVTSSALLGPVRGGIFALAGSREEAGAGYFGAMELGGNLWDRAVTLSTAAARAFDGAHGDGILTAAGEANASTWNGALAIAGRRGGSWGDAAPLHRLADRSGAENILSNRAPYNGFRAVRTAP